MQKRNQRQSAESLDGGLACTQSVAHDAETFRWKPHNIFHHQNEMPISMSHALWKVVRLPRNGHGSLLYFVLHISGRIVPLMQHARVKGLVNAAHC